MRNSLAVAVARLSSAIVAPASAQMCGASKNGDKPAGTCGASSKKAESKDGMQSRPEKSAEGGCACCRDMAMMHDMDDGKKRAPDHSGLHDMPGMKDAPEKPQAE